MNGSKGHWGYLKKRKTVLGLELVLACVIVAVLWAFSRFGPEDYRTILTVITILGVLPAANIAVKLIAIFPYRGESAEQRKEVTDVCTNGLLDEELVISCSEQPTAYFPYISIYDGQVICFTESPKCDEKKFSEYLKKIIADNEVKTDVKIIKDRKKFVRRLKELEPHRVDRANCDEKLLKAEGTLRAISM